ncbi:ATP-grasp domain-containing protein [Kaarinaea lacus]
MTSVPCILLVAPPDSYRVAPYIRAAQKLGVAIKIASHGEHSLVNEIAEGIHINLDSPDAAVATIVSSSAQYNFRGIVAADDKATEIVALAAKALNLPHNPPQAVHLTRWKHKARKSLQEAGLPVPEHWVATLSDIHNNRLPDVPFPCVIKPLNLSASRGVIRCDNAEDLKKAANRISTIVDKLAEPESKSKALIERFIPGKEVALEAVLQQGKLIPIAIFDKPDPLDGPYFEETYYITPSRLDRSLQIKLCQIIEAACSAYGLATGPVHAELRIDGDNIYIIEIAARTIGGECAKLIELASNRSLESIVIEYAMGLNPDAINLDIAAGVMMIPTPRSGVLRRVEGVLNAQVVKNIKSVNLSIREGHELIALPEGASYLGFIFATAETPAETESALRQAYEKLTIVVDPLWKIGGDNPRGASNTKIA